MVNVTPRMREAYERHERGEKLSALALAYGVSLKSVSTWMTKVRQQGEDQAFLAAKE
jgi:hypothetical protein